MTNHNKRPQNAIKDLRLLEREIDQLGVRKIFSPHTPIEDDEQFRGRRKEKQQIFKNIHTPGLHSLLYGERGIGKTSLANIAAEEAYPSARYGDIYSITCNSATSFNSILYDLLKQIDFDISLTEIETKKAIDGTTKLKTPFFEGGIGGNTETVEKRHGPAKSINQLFVVEQLIDVKGLVIIDEVDRLENADDKKSLAEFIKLLSDKNAEFKILLVGIAETGEELSGGHPSISRCLNEIKLDRMSNSEIAEIIIGAEKHLPIKFEEVVINDIVNLSAGYPYFAHLLALNCVEIVIEEKFLDSEQITDHTAINSDHLRIARKKAADSAEASLKRIYRDAIRSASTERYKHILCAAASIDQIEITAREVRHKLLEQTGEEISPQSLNNHFKRFVSEGTDSVLRRISKGVYKFNDPRMPSYIKIANEMN